MKVLTFDKNQLPDAIDESLDVLMEEAYGCDPGPYKNLVTLDEDGSVIGHLAAYTREAEVEGAPVLIGMIGNVATRRTHRNQGIAKALVSAAHDQFRAQSMLYSVLFAYEPKVYLSSGYRLITNKLKFYSEGKWQTDKVTGSMHCELVGTPWPETVVDLKGPLV